MRNNEMRRIFRFCIIALIIVSCSKEKVLLTGDVIGKITVYNQDGTIASDKSGVQVNLYSDKTLQDTTFTNIKGQYRFENISYGKYRIDLIKENFVKSAVNYTFNHVGGYSPSIFNGSVFKFPDYSLTIDSVKPMGSYDLLLIYSKIDGSTTIPFGDYGLIGYFGNDPTVSKDNYSFVGRGFVGDNYVFPTEDYDKANAALFNVSSDVPKGTYYVRFYLITNGQNLYTFNKEFLGKPSNVITCQIISRY
jgi:hypothetical protein